MDYQAYYDSAHQVSRQVDAGDYESALAGLRELLSSDISDVDKSLMSINLAVVYEKMGRSGDALRAYDRGIAYERPHSRCRVTEEKAGYLMRVGRMAEALAIYESLIGRSFLTEDDKRRLSHSIAALRNAQGG
jgi:tetratricopeptide (TPR) repeat protein